MTYYVLEFQTTEETGTILTTSYQNKDDAEEKYHTILMYACKSQVKKHGAMILDEDMSIVKAEMYEHEVPVNEPEDEKEESES